MNIAHMRAKLDLTQEELAEALEIPVKTIQGWEQRRRWPTGAATKLLKLFNQHPELFLDHDTDEHVQPVRVEGGVRKERPLRVGFRRKNTASE